MWVFLHQFFEPFPSTVTLQAAKHTELYKHIFTINSDKSIKERTYRLSKFKPISVGGTVYDLRSPKEIGPVIARSPQYGFDKYYILMKGTEQTISFAARVLHPESGRYLELYTGRFVMSNWANRRVTFPHLIRSRRRSVVYSWLFSRQWNTWCTESNFTQKPFLKRILYEYRLYQLYQMIQQLETHQTFYLPQLVIIRWSPCWNQETVK